MLPRAYSEQAEEKILSSFAKLSRDTAGRRVKEEECTIRTPFQRDRDRIIHCKAFRRLKHKTQVFLSPEGDHYRTRLTHTLEVSQIARTIAVALRLNEDLTEAIALGHDLGHTPFGHAGEKALAEVCPFGFTHYEQSVRVVEILEKDHRGLNLTYEVVDGIGNHTRDAWPATLEGCVVRLSDRIAYINHDIDDAIRAGVLAAGDIPAELTGILGDTPSHRIDTMIKSVIGQSFGRNQIAFSPEIAAATEALHTFMFAKVYTNPVAKAEERKAIAILKDLYGYFCAHAQHMPEEYSSHVADQGIERTVCDYIAGMSDRYALKIYADLFIPKGWEAQ